LLTAVVVAAAYLIRQEMQPLSYLLLVVSFVSFIGTLFLAYAYVNTYITVDKDYVTVYTQVSVFGVQATQCEMLEVEDVLVNQSGIFRIAFDFGTIEIQTAGTRPNFKVTELNHPGRAKAQIIGLSTGK
jgi:hypothetical protein